MMTLTSGTMLMMMTTKTIIHQGTQQKQRLLKTPNDQEQADGSVRFFL